METQNTQFIGWRVACVRSGFTFRGFFTRIQDFNLGIFFFLYLFFIHKQRSTYSCVSLLIHDFSRTRQNFRHLLSVYFNSNNCNKRSVRNSEIYFFFSGVFHIYGTHFNRKSRGKERNLCINLLNIQKEKSQFCIENKFSIFFFLFSSISGDGTEEIRLVRNWKYLIVLWFTNTTQHKKRTDQNEENDGNYIQPFKRKNWKKLHRIKRNLV